jgi:hypothetical protein
MIHAGNLAIENSAFDFDVFRDPAGEFHKAAKCVSISGNQFTLAVLQMRQCPEPIDLQFVDEIIRVKRFGTAGKSNGS